MARIRTIKPEFFKHSGLFDAEKETGLPLRLTFAGLWVCCDREGRFKWRPRELKLDTLPYDDCDFSRVLDALATRGFIVKYASGTEFFGYIPSWHDHQFINNKEAQSILPNPMQNQAVDACVTREQRVEDASDTRGVKEGKGKEEGKEGMGNAREPRSETPPPPQPLPVFMPKLPASAGANGEFALAQELGKEIKLAMRPNDVALVAQVITNEADEHGGPLEAKDFIRDKALEARARGEAVTLFWLQDRKFATAEQDVYAAYLKGDQ